MTKHDKNLKGITRREMLVGSAVAGTGLVVGYSGLPGAVGGAREALAAANASRAPPTAPGSPE